MSLIKLSNRNSQQAKCKLYWFAFAKIGGDGKCSESIAVGSKAFVEETKERLGFKVKGRKIIKRENQYELRKPQSIYNGNFDPENSFLRAENDYFWDVIS